MRLWLSRHAKVTRIRVTTQTRRRGTLAVGVHH